MFIGCNKEHFGLGIFFSDLECKLKAIHVRMPEMNGFEFAFKVREKNPKAKVLLITAYEHGDLETAGIYSSPSLQIDEFLKKPLLGSKLLEAAWRHLSMSATKP